MFDSKIKEVKRKKLEELYDNYLKKMKEINFPETIINFFVDSEYRKEVISKAMEINFPDNHIPFLFVATSKYFGNYSYFQRSHRVCNLFSMVHNGDKKGEVDFLDPCDIVDMVGTPRKGLYVIYDVENGKEMLGKTPKKAKKFLKEEGRLGVTFEEGINLCVFTNVLSKHYVECIESFYLKTPFIYEKCLKPPHHNRVMTIRLSRNNREPKLDWHHIDHSDGWRGAASCGSRN